MTTSQESGSERIKLVLATANPDKAAEIVSILRLAGIGLIPRPPGVADVDETGTTLVDNARLKAVAIGEFTGRPSVADDTGLEVDALGGAPGVYAARYAGEAATYHDNVRKLLDDLARLPDHGGERRARFRTVALAWFPDGTEVVAEGSVEGRIANGPQGEHGFGYDPVFIPAEGDGRTFAEMSTDEKHACSHRGRAFRALADALAARADGGVG